MIIIFLINNMHVHIIDYQTPLQKLSPFQTIPFAFNMCPKVFSFVCYIYVGTFKCIFIGYSSAQKGYKCFHPPIGKYYISMDVRFCE